MIDALIALVVSIFVILVFTPPPWIQKLISIGGFGFCVWVLILVIRYLLNLSKQRNP